MTHVPEAGRYELRLDGRLIGLAAYRRRNGCIVFTHTEVDEACSGRGLGSRLAAAALDDAEREGLEVVPLCSFIVHYIDRHPRYGRWWQPTRPQRRRLDHGRSRSIERAHSA